MNKKKIFLLILIILVLCFFFYLNSKKNLMINLLDKNIEEVKVYANDNELNLVINEEYSEISKGNIINQSISEGTKFNKNDELIINVSLGVDYEGLKVNELGHVPIMMYHGIVDNPESISFKGNVDKAGYHRTKEAFREDLEFYYKNNYRMIRLVDYVNGVIDVKAGYSPIILTFDDGLVNNFNVTGLDSNGNIIIDPNCAVGILEQFKEEHSDFNVTATFFLNGGLFRQSKYNEKILNWLVDNGYDVGNHSYSHVDFTEVSSSESNDEIGKIYELLDKYIPNKYVNIVALPFGSPYKKTHENFSHILSGEYNSKKYETIATLRVGWESEVSPFSKKFDKTFLKRIRAYDNNGEEFDIEMNFKWLEKNRYISDGDKRTISISEDKVELINNINELEVITY